MKRQRDRYSVLRSHVLRGLWSAVFLLGTLAATILVTNVPAQAGTQEGLNWRSYDDEHGDNYIDPITNFFLATHEGQGIQTDNIDYGGLTGVFAGITGNESLGMLWWGVFRPDTDGVYSFGTRSDDGSVIYIDLNRDGDWADAGEMIVNNKGSHGEQNAVGQCTLTGGMQYGIAVGFHQGGGGIAIRARWKKGSESNYDNMQFINAVSGRFFTGYGALNLAEPADGQGYLTGTAISASAVVYSGTAPHKVQFFSRRGSGPYSPAGDIDTAPPYTADLGVMPVGTYNIYARAVDSVGATYFSPTNAFSVNLTSGGMVTHYTGAGGTNWTAHTFKTVGKGMFETTVDLRVEVMVGPGGDAGGVVCTSAFPVVAGRKYAVVAGGDAGSTFGPVVVPSGSAADSVIVRYVSFGVCNQPVSAVTSKSATLSGRLLGAGGFPTSVCVLWGTKDGGNTWDWAKTGWLKGDNRAAGTTFKRKVTGLTGNKTYYYTAGAKNKIDKTLAAPPIAFITGEVNLTAKQNKAWEKGTEGAAVPATVTVSRPASCVEAPLPVAYRVSGTANNGLDYPALSGTVTIAAGATDAGIVVAPGNDRIVEGDETVIVTLLPGPYVVGSGRAATVTIVDTSVRSFYVSPDASPAPPYNTWATGFRSLQQALDFSEAKDDAVIYLAGGKTFGGPAIGKGDNDNTVFRWRNAINVQLLGGYRADLKLPAAAHPGRRAMRARRFSAPRARRRAC